ncbi:DUF6525 family protein [Rhodalgimonas zhirmunskyi]|uniref:DUF6525 family protein n=1 Tax=Rhodalgimonas zhirmunskyi TaxID=2964767 RepID=A0AAJ1U9X4_9RHOB|nr:DUF6525 family protein [Rhodoalgimonas zhirmunskyi]MDQ2093933.1 DUF6525 family protein [Rhodoalgimonas zhirmunskyi]
MNHNARTSLSARSRTNPMAAHDRLPPAARAWVAQAVLPWSAASVARIWRRALAQSGCEKQALARLSAIERATLEKEKGPYAKRA